MTPTIITAIVARWARCRSPAELRARRVRLSRVIARCCERALLAEFAGRSPEAAYRRAEGLGVARLVLDEALAGAGRPMAA